MGIYVYNFTLLLCQSAAVLKIGVSVPVFNAENMYEVPGVMLVRDSNDDNTTYIWYFMVYEPLTALKMLMLVFWVVTQCGLVGVQDGDSMFFSSSEM